MRKWRTRTNTPISDALKPLISAGLCTVVMVALRCPTATQQVNATVAIRHVWSIGESLPLVAICLSPPRRWRSTGAMHARAAADAGRGGNGGSYSPMQDLVLFFGVGRSLRNLGAPMRLSAESLSVVARGRRRGARRGPPTAHVRDCDKLSATAPRSP